MKFSRYQDDQNWWRWSLRKGRTLIAESGQGYRTKQECDNAIRLVRRSYAAAVPIGFREPKTAITGELLQQIVENDVLQGYQ